MPYIEQIEVEDATGRLRLQLDEAVERARQEKLAADAA